MQKLEELPEFLRNKKKLLEAPKPTETGINGKSFLEKKNYFMQIDYRL